MSVSAARTAGNSVRHFPRRFLRNAWLGLQARALRSLAAAARTRSRLPAHLRTGLDGEREAIFYLRRQGYTIVARRWRNAKLRGDLDLIAWDDVKRSDSKSGAKDAATLCFIEIKTRSRRHALPAEMAVDADKQETLRRLALAYIRRLPPHAQEAPVRFDVLSIYLEGSSHEGGIQSIEPTEPGFVLNKGAFQWA